jgi:cell division protein FtsZ
MEFDLPKDQSSIIKVIGIGGGGSNAVNHMFKQGIKGVDFVICNTDEQALEISPIPNKIQLGISLTEGRGAGSIPEVGRNAAIENIDEIKELLGKNTKMVFVTAGMGGGTGTGAAPIIAQAAKEMGILTVGIITMPFAFEGKKRKSQAEDGIESIRENVDTLLVINNDKLREMYGNLALADAFAHADNVLTTASKGIAEIITRTGYINVDFEDVKTVMSEGGVAIMGSGVAEGEERAQKAVEQALISPLLNDNDINGANYVLLNITFGNKELLMDEISDITDYISDASGSSADVIWGYGQDESLGDAICVTLIATGFSSNSNAALGIERKPERKIVSLEEEMPTMLTKPIEEEKTETTEETELEQEETIDEQTTPEVDDIPEPYISGVQEEEEEVAESEEQEEKEDEIIEETQTTFEFTINSTINETEPQAEDSIEKFTYLNTYDEDESIEPFISNKQEEEPAAEEPATTEDSVEMSLPQNGGTADPEEQQQKANDRIFRLKELSMKLRAPAGLSDLENEPAYKRRQVDLDDVPHSSESEISRFTLTDEDEDGEKKTVIRPNNSFLHDNVD